MIWLDEIRLDYKYSFSLGKFIVSKTLASQRLQEIDMIRIEHHFIRTGAELLPNLSLFIESAQEGESCLHVFKSSDPEEPVAGALSQEPNRSQKRNNAKPQEINLGDSHLFPECGLLPQHPSLSCESPV